VNIALTARNASALDAVASELAGFGVKTAAIPADIMDLAAQEDLVERTVAQLGKIDILINNAGLEYISRFASLSTELIHGMIQTNVVAPLLLTRLVLPQMLEQGSGHIVTISSLGGKKGSPYSATYAGTKAAVIEWSSGLRAELRKTGVSASVISPGFVTEAGMFAAYNLRAPRIAGESTPDDVAKAVVRAITRDIQEIIVNPGPVKLMTVLNAISPGLMSWVFKASGLFEFYRMRADENEKLASNRTED
jgi:short-subunit dehydrogenase